MNEEMKYFAGDLEEFLHKGHKLLNMMHQSMGQRGGGNRVWQGFGNRGDGNWNNGGSNDMGERGWFGVGGYDPRIG